MMRILIAEDEVHLAEAVSQILKKNNYPWTWSTTAIRSGLDYAQSGIYDLLLLEIMTPEMDGITVLKKLRSEGNHTPVILLTAKGELSESHRASIMVPEMSLYRQAFCHRRITRRIDRLTDGRAKWFLRMG